MSTATISACNTYRYTLTRDWGLSLVEGMRRMLFIMLNPSTATAEINDRTVVRCIDFAQSLANVDIITNQPFPGVGDELKRRFALTSLEVVNLFAFRSPYPKDLRNAVDPVGPENNHHILEAAKRAKMVICAWGTPLADEPEHKARVAEVMKIVRQVHPTVFCLERSKNGHPRHPLMLKKTCKPFIYVN